MEEIIKTQIEGHLKKDVEDLELDSWKGTEISEEDRELLESFKHLSSISFRSSGLTSLRNFPRNKHLIKVELSDNQIEEGLENLAQVPGLLLLSLENNLINSFESLQPLTRLDGLLSLDLHGNPIADTPEYPKKVFEILPTLNAVDGLDIHGTEVEEICPEHEPEEEEEEDEEEYSLDDEDDEIEDDSEVEEEFNAVKRPRNSE